MVWKFRGAPADRPDRRQLGNEHLVSFWPVRGGPVVADGVVYFGAGIWPIFGVFVHALDAETGKPKWTNASLNYVGPVRIDHDGFAEVGMSPQGYFVALPDRLLMPNSRALPAGLERATGKLTYYMQGCRHGDSRVAAHGQYAFVGKEGVLNLGDLREVGSRWAGRGNNKPDGYRGPRAARRGPRGSSPGYSRTGATTRTGTCTSVPAFNTNWRMAATPRRPSRTTSPTDQPRACSTPTTWRRRT